MSSESWKTIGKAGLVSSMLSLVLGSLLLWSCQSWDVFVWLQTKLVFRDERTRIVMVNTADENALKLKKKHQLEGNLGLIALILNDSDKLLVTVWREGHLRVPDNSDMPTNKAALLEDNLLICHLRVLSWMEAGNFFAWVLLCLGSPAVLFAVRSWAKQRFRSIGTYSQFGSPPPVA